MADISNITLPNGENYDIKDITARNDIAINRTTLGTQCKNLLDNTAVTKPVNGITFTVNSDKSVTVNGTATATAQLVVGTITKDGNYILTGCPSGGSASTYMLSLAYHKVSGGITYADENGSGRSVVFDSEKYSRINVRIQINKGVTVSNKTFYPMLRDSEVTDSIYEPYQPSVQEQINNFGAQQQLLCDYSSAATSGATIQITGLFSNYSAVICIVKYSYGTTSITLPLKYIKSIGTSKEYSPVSDLGFKYVDDDDLYIGGADAAISNVKIISLY